MRLLPLVKNEGVVKIMRTASSLSVLAAVICFSGVALAQSQFAGKWQTKTSPVTGKRTITVNIIESENKLSGTVVLVNPDRSEMEMPILNPQLKGKTLEFETSLQGTPFDWRLTLKKGNASGLLHGTDRRPGKGGQGGEMVIEEHVVKKL
jgi:hypothetical protein